MNLVLVDLKNLQEIDDQLKAVRQAVGDSAARLSEAQARLKGFEGKLASVSGELAKAQASRRELEAELSQLSVKRENNQKRQGAVKNNTEFAALAREAEFLAGRIDATEDEILELLDKIEKAEVEKADLALLVTEETGLYGRAAAETAASTQAGNETLADLTARRELLAKSLPPERLRQYNEIFATRAGRAVAPAVDGLCQACRLSFPLQLFNELQRGEEIKTCPNCGRLLYPGLRPGPADASHLSVV